MYFNMRQDSLTSSARSACMGAIRSAGTGPELIVRKVVRALGLSCRYNGRDLRGAPDLVLDSFGTVIFVHGCFWHMHRCKRGRSSPITNAEFWRAKRMKNRARDRNTVSALRRAGWRVLIVWECETRNQAKLVERLIMFFARDVRKNKARKKYNKG